MFKEIKKWLLQWLWIMIIVWISGISYAAFINISTVSDWEQLTSWKWNEIVNRLNAINQEQLATAWVNFDGRSCTGGSGNECTIRWSYNILKVERQAVWRYLVSFSNTMDNTNYSISGLSNNIDGNPDGNRWDVAPFKWNNNWNTVNNMEIITWWESSSYTTSQDMNEVHIQIFWGKN